MVARDTYRAPETGERIKSGRKLSDAYLDADLPVVRRRLCQAGAHGPRCIANLFGVERLYSLYLSGFMPYITPGLYDCYSTSKNARWTERRLLFLDSIIVERSRFAKGHHPDMVHVRFGLCPRRSMTLGPAPSYLISGDVLCVGPVWSVAAVYRNHAWEVGGSRFARFEFIGKGLTLANFDGVPDGQVAHFGPFDVVLMAGGTLFADDRQFAKFVEETFAWSIYDTKTCLLNIIIAGDHVEPMPASV